jgi:pimeloyl-ACP methyl ester carboxylesterase
MVLAPAMVRSGALLVAFAASSLPTPARAALGGCTDGVTCGTLEANGFIFDCRFAGSAASETNVLMLHGFPEWSDMYMPLMRVLGQNSIRSVACNQRGYSPLARPALEEEYNYNELRRDVFALAAAANFSRFHLVGHDHGAALGWVAAASAQGSEMLLSYTSLSIPHVRAFAEGLFGPTADVQQQVASQYFTMFTMANSSSIDGEFLFRTMGKSSGDKNTDHFTTAEDFQKALWWYNGATDAGYFPLPPTFSVEELLVKYHNPSMSALRAIFPGSAAAKAHPQGIGANITVANVSMPTLFVCGETDSAILCTRPYSRKTSQYCSGAYQYLQVQCGHDVLAKSGGDGCKTVAEVDKVNGAILAHIQHAARGQ